VLVWHIRGYCIRKGILWNALYHSRFLYKTTWKEVWLELTMSFSSTVYGKSVGIITRAEDGPRTIRESRLKQSFY